ncbi:hypothetical protein EBU94_09610 [bacterium]|nr:hypothetical protein [bacterium]
MLDKSGKPLSQNFNFRGWMQDIFDRGRRFDYFASGGKVFGSGGPRSDSIPAMLSNGEYVVQSSAVSKYGKDFMDAINKGTYGFNMGGLASSMPNYTIPGVSKYQAGNVSNMEININVNAQTNSSPEEIANAIRKEFDKISTKQKMMKTSRVVIA